MIHRTTTLFWFRQDLRLSDNPGLFEAAKKGLVMPVYILDDQNPGAFKMGAASRGWLHHSLNELNNSLDGMLNVYVGESKKTLLNIIEKNNIGAVYWNRCYEPWRIKNDAEIETRLKAMEIEAKNDNGSLLWEPWEILKSDKTFYKVYTPFYRRARLQASNLRRPLPKPKKLTLVRDHHGPCTIDTLNLIPRENWYKKIEKYWIAGEKAAQQKLKKFLDQGLVGYKKNRDYPHKPNVSRLSPHLHLGEISPNQVWFAAQEKNSAGLFAEDVDHFLSELGWREFFYYLLYHFPDLPRKNFQHKFDQFPWKFDAKLLEAWQKGQTGYPIVDAGMRELWQTGYMHNRVRMIVASFLVKNLLLHWHHGEDWFWDCLLDADLANNSASWQWVAGSGADAAPYFRIFNPITQGEKFDPDGEYTRRFVPELSQLPKAFLFKPWEASESVLSAAGVVLGQTYPRPVIDLRNSRVQAMQAYISISG